ncbi:MAG: hypothetical protein OEV92_11555 [Nitrospinota bacterium]|nr:hypothetical protein [Nitrospinota bacterium]
MGGDKFKPFSVKPLKDIGVSLLDCVHKTPKAMANGIPYVAIPDIKNGHIDFSNARRISQSDYEVWTQKTKPAFNRQVQRLVC